MHALGEAEKRGVEVLPYLVLAPFAPLIRDPELLGSQVLKRGSGCATIAQGVPVALLRRIGIVLRLAVSGSADQTVVLLLSPSPPPQKKRTHPPTVREFFLLC